MLLAPLRYLWWGHAAMPGSLALSMPTNPTASSLLLLLCLPADALGPSVKQLQGSSDPEVLHGRAGVELCCVAVLGWCCAGCC